MLMFAPWLRSLTSLVSWVLLTTTQSSTRRPNRCQAASRLTPKNRQPSFNCNRTPPDKTQKLLLAQLSIELSAERPPRITSQRTVEPHNRQPHPRHSEDLARIIKQPRHQRFTNARSGYAAVARRITKSRPLEVELAAPVAKVGLE